MDVASLSRSATPTAAERAPPAAAEPVAASTNPTPPAAKADEPRVSPVISLDADTNKTILKFQESTDAASFQLPSRTALEYQRHQQQAAPESSEDHGTAAE